MTSKRFLFLCASIFATLSSRAWSAGGTTFYFHNQSATGIYRLMNDTAPFATAVSATASYCPDREIVDFATEKAGPMSIPAGTWNFNFYAYTAPGTGSFQVQVGTIDTFGTYNWIFTTNSPATATAPPASQLSWSVARPLLNVPAGDRLAVVIYGQGSSCPAPYYEQLAYDSAAVPSSLEIPMAPTGFTPTFTPTPTTVSGTTYYFHNTPASGLFKLMDNSAPSGAGSTTITVACPGPELIDFASPVLGPLTIPPGFWNFNLYSSVAPGLAQYQVQVWSVDAGGNPSTFYFTAASSPGVLYGPPGSPVAWSHFRASNVVLPAGHRLGILIYVVNGITCPDNFKLQMDYDGLSSPSSLNFPLQPPTPTPTVTSSFSDSPTPVDTDTVTATPSSSDTPSITWTRTATPSITETRTVTPSITPTSTVTPSITPSITETRTSTASVTPSITMTGTVTPSATPSISETSTASPSPSSSVTPTGSSTSTPSPSASPTPTPTPTPTWSPEPWIWPLSASSVPDVMNTSFGPRMNYSQWDMHDGIDLPALTGTAMVAVASGFVHLTGEAGANGASSRHVVLRLPDALGNTIYVSYFHLSTVAATLTIGAPVAQGATVGTVGSDDASYAHLHFEIRKNSPFQIASIHPLHYLPYTDTLNFEPASPPLFSYLTGGLAGRISFTAASKEEGDLARVELDFRQGGALLSTRVVDFDDKTTINEGNSDSLQWVNDIAVEGYQWSNMGLSGRTDLHYGVLFRAFPALADNVVLRVVDIGGNTRTSGPFALGSPAPSCENLTFEDGQMAPTGWSALTSATGSGTTVTAQAASARASAYGMQCLDASTGEAFDQRAAINRPLDPAKIEWRLDAWMRAASLNLPLNGDYTRVLTLENTGAGYPVAGAGYRRSGGVDYYAGYYRNVTWTGTFDTTTVTAALGAWQQWSLAFKRLGTRESTVIFLLDGSELSRSQWDSTLFPFDALRVGLASTRAGAQADLSVDDVQVREADDLGCLATPTPTPTSSATVTLTNTPSPSATSSATPSPSETSTRTISETDTPGPTATYTVTPSPSAMPSSTSTITPTDTPSPSPSETPSITPTSTFTLSVTPADTPTVTPPFTLTISATPTDSGTGTATESGTPTNTATPTLSDTATTSPSGSPSNTPVDTATATPSDSPSSTLTETPSASPTSTVSSSESPSLSPSPTFSLTLTPSSTSSASNTPSFTVTASSTPSNTPSPSSTSTATPSISASGTASPTATPTSTASPSPSSSTSPSQTPSPSATPSTASITNVVNTWTPVLLTVPVGTTVTWTWTGFHNVVSTTGSEPYTSGAATSGGSFNHTFNTPGTYTYQCAIHGASMSGTIIVTAPATATPTFSATATVTPSISMTSTQSPVFSPSITSTLSPSFTSSPAVSATATPSVSMTSTLSPVSSPSDTPTVSPSFTASPLVSATPTPALVTLDGLLKPTLAFLHLTEITRVFSVPSPLSRERGLLMVEMTGNADDFEVQVFSPAFALISKTLIPGPAGPGLNYLPFDASMLPGGVLFVRVIARSNSQRSQRTARVYLLP